MRQQLKKKVLLTQHLCSVTFLFLSILHQPQRNKLAFIHSRQFSLNKVLLVRPSVFLLHIHLFDNFAFSTLLLIDDSHVRSQMSMQLSVYESLCPITACIFLKVN